MKLRTKIMRKDATIPTRGSKSAAGYDLYACNDGKGMVYIYPGETEKINTGLAVAIPDGYFGAIYARSGLASKKGLRPANCVGVIDSDYRGEIAVALHNDSNTFKTVEHGERIAQLVIQKYEEIDGFEVTDELDETERGEGGFGSTGK